LKTGAAQLMYVLSDLGKFSCGEASEVTKLIGYQEFLVTSGILAALACTPSDSSITTASLNYSNGIGYLPWDIGAWSMTR